MRKIILLLSIVLLIGLVGAVENNSIGLNVTNLDLNISTNEIPCVEEGGVVPMIANPPECCAGLILAPPSEEVVGIIGTCVREKICVDMCGDGECQEIVCLDEGCPCAESVESCAEDCAEEGGFLSFLFANPILFLVIAAVLIIVGLKIAKWVMWIFAGFAIVVALLLYVW